jgi:hypothetical protein
MKSRIIILLFAAAALHLVSGCSGSSDDSALHVLEELEASSSIEEPEHRLERLNIFVKNHENHNYRIIGHERIFKTLADDLNDPDEAVRYLDGVIDRETDYRVRGLLHYRKFAHFWEADSELALSIAGGLLDGGERYSRLYLYLGYYLMSDPRLADMAERALARARDAAVSSYGRSQAEAALGMLLEGQGKRDDAVAALKRASSYPLANRRLGRLQWESGEREEALESFMRLVAGVPGSREDVKLDSLYALVYPHTDDLDRRIMKHRIIDEGLLQDQSFVDIEGRKFDLAAYRGKNLVINIWSPT